MEGPTTGIPTNATAPERARAPSERHPRGFSLELLSLALMLTMDGVNRSRLLSVWLVSLGVFPYPLIALGLRSRPDRSVVLVLAGVGLIGVQLYSERDVGYSWGFVFFALQLALTGLWQREFVKRAPHAPMPVGSLLLGCASLGCGLVHIWLPR